MSLDPNAYRDSIGVARVPGASAIVHLDRAVALNPPGLEGLGLTVRDGLTWADLGRGPEVWPPACSWTAFAPVQDRTPVSARLAAEITRIRSEYLARVEQGDSWIAASD